MPRDSAFARTLRGDRAYWDENTELIASLIDAVERQTFYLLKVNGNDPPQPTPVPRPGESGEPVTVSLTDFANSLKGD